jgi:DNA topoisomerase IA
MKKIALMVAEKPSVAKAIQEFLGAGKSVKKVSTSII